MAARLSPLRVPKWPFLLGYGLLVALASWVALTVERPLEVSYVVACVAAVVLGVIIAFVPYVLELIGTTLIARHQAAEASLTLAIATERLETVADRLQGMEEDAAQSVLVARQVPTRIEEGIEKLQKVFDGIDSDAFYAIAQEVKRAQVAIQEVLPQLESLPEALADVRSAGDGARIERLEADIEQLQQSLERAREAAEGERAGWASDVLRELEQLSATLTPGATVVPMTPEVEAEMEAENAEVENEADEAEVEDFAEVEEIAETEESVGAEVEEIEAENVEIEGFVELEELEPEDANDEADETELVEDEAAVEAIDEDVGVLDEAAEKAEPEPEAVEELIEEHDPSMADQLVDLPGVSLNPAPEEVEESPLEVDEVQNLAELLESDPDEDDPVEDAESEPEAEVAPEPELEPELDPEPKPEAEVELEPEPGPEPAKPARKGKMDLDELEADFDAFLVGDDPFSVDEDAEAEPAGKPSDSGEAAPAEVAPDPEPEATPAKPARRKRKSKPKAEDPSQEAIGFSGPATIEAIAYVGIMNFVSIRGNGPGLNWDTGLRMDLMEIGRFRWATTEEPDGAFEIELWLNDREPDLNGRMTVRPGDLVAMEPRFASVE